VNNFDAKALIALTVLLGGFGLLGIFVYQGKTPDATTAAIIAGAMSGVVNYFFGHLNGTLSGQLQASTQLVNAALAQLPPQAPMPPPVRVTTTVEPPTSAGAAA